MLAGLGASLKGALGGHLSFTDQAKIMGASLTHPERLLGKLAGSVHASWESVTGSSDGAAFTEYWRTEKFFPLLKAIADQPTPALQRWKLRDLLLVEEEGMTTSAQVLQLPEGQAAVFLIDHPNQATAGSSITWKRDYVGLEMGFQLLNICALLELARKGFGANADNLQSWADFYGKAFEHMFKLRVVLRTLHVIDPPSHTHENSQAAELACEPIFAQMRSLLAAIRDEISNGREDKKRCRELYNGIVDAKADFLREVCPSVPLHSERI